MRSNEVPERAMKTGRRRFLRDEEVPNKEDRPSLLARLLRRALLRRYREISAISVSRFISRAK